MPDVGDRVLEPVRGTVARVFSSTVVVVDDDGVSWAFEPMEVRTATKIPLVVCPGCGMWQHSSRVSVWANRPRCDVCTALAKQ